MEKLTVPIKLSSHSAIVPQYAHEGDAGLDLCSTIKLKLEPFERALIPTGISIAIPPGYAGYILPRSGLAIKHGISLVNSPGLIDSNYRGEIQVIAINLDPQHTFTVHAGDRIAQLVISHVETILFQSCESLDDTKRGNSGFGSSGLKQI